ncbi:glycoside hydrolase [Paenibacillus sp. CAA11]|nr:glycoside hydrolase [Paenibacillus sp. CAA11]
MLPPNNTNGLPRKLNRGVPAWKEKISHLEGTVYNPLIWADIPDPDVIRVGEIYYMTSTTMHFNPGVPVMKSYDLVHWNIVNYVYDTLEDGDEQRLSNGRSEYGKGSWASSLRFHSGKFYVVFSSNSAGKTYIYQTLDIEKGPWTRSTLAFYHDMSLLFDDDGRVYLVHGSGDIRITELTSDATMEKEDGLNKVIIRNASLIAGPNVGLPAEGAHIQKINGYYYISLITWPKGGMRTQLIYRSDTIDGPYEGRVALQDAGIAQGGLIDTCSGDWYALLFGDRGSVGRIPYLVPVTWKDDWPILGYQGKVPDSLSLPLHRTESNLVTSDEFDQRSESASSSSNLALAWQWNHNPDGHSWSLTERPGFLRLKNGRICRELLDARNTLTQRSFGPESSGCIAIEVGHMKDGDTAGLAALQENYGFVGVKMNGSAKSIVMANGSTAQLQVIESIPLTQDRVYLKIEFDFYHLTDKAYFYYSLDGNLWTPIGNTLQMTYTLPHFVGYRFALFNYATVTAGGYVDFDYFRVDDQITANHKSNSDLRSTEDPLLTKEVDGK